MKFASLILARKNSSRLFQKNKRKFLGVPLFLHHIKLSKKIIEIKKIFISTDDEDIQNISKEYNIEILKRNPNFPFSNISEGPVGQLVEIINFLSTAASSKTLGKPSYLDERINKSAFFSKP